MIDDSATAAHHHRRLQVSMVTELTDEVVADHTVVVITSHDVMSKPDMIRYCTRTWQHVSDGSRPVAAAAYTDQRHHQPSTSPPAYQLHRWNEFCRGFKIDSTNDAGAPMKKAAPISFIYAFTGGMFGSVFVDHGEKHVISDPNGEHPMVGTLLSVG